MPEQTIYLHEPPDFFTLLKVLSEEAEPGWLKHVDCEGARFHVLSWSGGGRAGSVTHCSEPRCILNKPKESVNA